MVNFRGHHFGSNAISDFGSDEGVAVLDRLDPKADGLAGFVAPVGVVGGDADLDRADPVLGEDREGESGMEGKAKHGLSSNDIASVATRTTSFPKFLPTRRPIKAAGAFSSPSTKSSRYFILPWLTQVPIWEANSGYRWP